MNQHSTADLVIVGVVRGVGPWFTQRLVMGRSVAQADACCIDTCGTCCTTFACAVQEP